MEIDFSKIVIKDIEGNDVAVDISKDLGNMMYVGASDIAVADLGHDIYHKKKIDLTGEQADAVCLYIEKGFKAVIKKAILPILTKKE